MTSAIQVDGPLIGERDAGAVPWWSSRSALFALLVALVVAAISAGAVVLAWSQPLRAPADDSADAGFARDMADHHSQAVEMALIALSRTEDPALRTLATDILLTQQAQVGLMRGWLDVWRLPATGREPRMAWMGHAMEGPMPGMATRDEVAGLRELPPEEADRRFLELMIRHHEGSVVMARAGVELGEQPVVRDLAEAILTSQQAEVEAMEELLRREPVSLDEGLEEAAPYAGPNGATYPVLADPDRRRGAAYPVANVPTHLRIDRDGIVREFALAALNRGQRVERAAAILASLVGA